jgi:hypothetical protein
VSPFLHVRLIFTGYCFQYLLLRLGQIKFDPARCPKRGSTRNQLCGAMRPWDGRKFGLRPFWQKLCVRITPGVAKRLLSLVPFLSLSITLGAFLARDGSWSLMRPRKWCASVIEVIAGGGCKFWGYATIIK